jgi:ATP-dependent metalloprotease FtsH
MKIQILQALLLISSFIGSNCFFPHFTHTNHQRKYPISRTQKHQDPQESKPQESGQNPNPNSNPEKDINIRPLFNRFKYPLSKSYYENYVKRLNSRNASEQNDEILRGEDFYHQSSDDEEVSVVNISFNESENNSSNPNSRSGFRVIISKSMFEPFQRQYDQNNNQNQGDDEDEDDDDQGYRSARNKKSENFKVITKHPTKFADIGGYDKVKQELLQCVDILTNYQKYANYSVRVPKGLILEGPPGNGKTLLAKGFAGEAKVGFIAVSGSEFQEKYVGVGSSRVRELFKLAKKNAPCIVFIDEIDAIGRHRSGDGETSSSERDNTLNELLVALDGFKSNNGVFLIGATNRVDLLDPALVRPGRIDKKIYIGLPDSDTRKAILNIHTKGKPYDESIVIDDLVDLTMGLSGAQIENMLNEAMLNALREDRQKIEIKDVDSILNKILAGWQPTEHHFNNDIIDHIVIHEMGHAIVGLLAEHHSKMTKVIINFSSPRSPGYTVFEASESTIYTREALFEHLAILLAGRIAEESYCEVSITTGAINDFEEAYKLAEKMILYYGMGSKVIYPSNSDKYKEMIDNEVIQLIDEAYAYSQFIIENSMDLIMDCAEILKLDKIMHARQIMEMVNSGKYKDVLELLKK